MIVALDAEDKKAGGRKVRKERGALGFAVVELRMRAVPAGSPPRRHRTPRQGPGSPTAHPLLRWPAS